MCSATPLLLAQEKNPFIISSPQTVAHLTLGENEEPVVHTAAELFAGDVHNVSGRRPEIKSGGDSDYLIKIGTIGVNADFDQTCKEEGIDINKLRSGWEAYVIKAVTDPQGKKNSLLVAGSHPRGTAYGLMELSRMIGISPWYWWADVRPENKDVVQVPGNLFIEDAPTVRYRGIFLNDEGWGLWPWAKLTFDPEFGDIGPKTYEKIFEALLRLRANHIWPAMHPNTKSFQLVAENREVARKYGIVVGSSHAEPLLFNNAGSEWNTRTDGPWDYNRNKDRILEVLDSRVRTASEFENIYTMGLRGVHDSRMQGVSSAEEGARLLEKIIEDQRAILTRHIDKPADEIPQVFIPYKEVQEQYDAGLDLPDDITLMWADDNHGYIRRFSNEAEQNRTGRAGVYYHLSYLGAPHPYLWLSPTSPALIWREMTRAWLHNMDQIWIANVGDFKRREWETEFFMDLAWDINSWNAGNIHNFFETVASRDISQEYAGEIAELMWEYYRLATERKPEFMGFNKSQWAGWPPVQDPHYSLWRYGDEAQRRIRQYQDLRSRAKKLYDQLPETVSDVYFQLVYYPIAGAAAMNEKWLYAYKSREYAAQGRVAANQMSDSAFLAFGKILELTRYYNQEVADGKWEHMTDYKPGFRQGSTVFFEPVTARIDYESKRGFGLAIEGEANPLKPLTGSLPDINTRESEIKLNLAEARLSGGLVVNKDGEGAYLEWPEAAGIQRVISGPSRWDTLPYIVNHPAKAVFDFTFKGEPGGVHTLYLSVGHPDSDSDSWWVTLNDKQPVSVDDAVGRIRRLRVSDFVLKPGKNRLTIHPREDGAKLYGIEFVQESRRLNRSYAGSNRLPEFNRYTRKSYFIDIFNVGEKIEQWEAQASEPWIILSSGKGTLSKGAERIQVKIDYENAPNRSDINGHIDISNGELSYRVTVSAFNKNLQVAENAYIEDNGVIALPAHEYNQKKAGELAAWAPLPGFGRSGSAMLTLPMGDWYVDDLSDIRRKCPVLEYEVVVVKGGAANVIVEAVPAFPLTRDQPLRCAVSIDDGEPRWISFKMDDSGSRVWERNVLESRMTGSTELSLAPGVYRLKLWGADPSVNVDRILIDFGGLESSYVGPQSSKIVKP